MRIIQVANVRWFNATSWYALYLARLAAEAGHDSLVLTLEDTETHDKARKWGLDVCTLPLNSSNPIVVAKGYRKLRTLVHDWRPDVVNCHRGESFWLWCLLRRTMGGFRLARTRGDQRPPKGDPINRWLHCSAADAIIATNSVMHAHFQNTFRIPDNRLYNILGGVDRTRFINSPEGRNRLRAEFGFGEDDLVLGILGRFDEVKGHRELIQAVSRLRRERGMNNLRLLLAGFPDPTPVSEVEAWIRDAGLEDAAVISGKRADVAGLISTMDLGVVASKWSETIARAALEIMSCGVPLIGTDVGVMPDLLSRSAIFPAADVDAMAEAIAHATDAAVRKTLREEQEILVSQLTGEAFLERTLAAYRGAGA